MLARCIARRVTRLRTARALTRSVYEFAPGRQTTFEDSGIPPLYAAPAPPEEALSGWELKSHLTSEADFNEPELDDEGLLEFYRDMIYSGSEGVVESASEVIDVRRQIREAERRRMISSMIARLQSLTESAAIESRTVPEVVDNPADEAQSMSDASDEAGSSSSLIAHLIARRPSLRVLDILASLHIPQSFESMSLDVKGKGRETHGPILPLGLLSVKEWQALFEDSMLHKDFVSAEQVLRQMSLHGFEPVQAWAASLVAAYAKAGDRAAVERFYTDMAQVFADAADYQAAAMTAILNGSGHRKAIHKLKQHEQEGTPLAQKAYQVVLHHLSTGSPTYRPDSHSRALARDLFAHMRLMAHPTPSRELYRDMITACAAPMDPQPERARDLWLEMTTESDTPALEPEKEDYNAIIRALCTSKEDYLEGFDIFRQMLSKHQDAVRVPFEDIPRATFSKYIPTLKTFSALLQGTKRAGDLERTRWLVLEMVKLVQAASLQTDVEIAGPDASVVADIFHAYATWTPPSPKPMITREESEGPESASQSGTQQANDSEGDYSDLDMAPIRNASEQAVESMAAENTETYSPSPLPRTHAEALREASAIWERVLYDVKAARTGDVPLIEYPFSQVRLDQRLVTAYQSVILHHVRDIPKAKELWGKAFMDANHARGTPMALPNDTMQAIVMSDPLSSAKLLEPSGWSYTGALEFCSYPRKMHQHSAERRQNARWDWSAALGWSKELWQRYIQLLDGAAPIRQLAMGETNPTPAPPGMMSSSPEARAWLYNFGLGDRQVERAFRAIIRTHANAGRPLEGLRILEDFRSRFPPRAILDTYRLVGRSGLSIRVEDPTSLAEPNVPPSLIWNDLSDLHQALLKDFREGSPESVEAFENGLATVKNLSMAYTAALFKRRRWRMQKFKPDVDTDYEYLKRKKERLVAEVPNKPSVTYHSAPTPSVETRFATPRGVRSSPGDAGFRARNGIPEYELAELAGIVASNPRTSSDKYKHRVTRSSKVKPRFTRERREPRMRESREPQPSGFGMRLEAR